MKTKIQINKRHKHIAVVIVAFLIFIALVGLYKEAMIPKVKNIDIPVYNYRNTADVNYKILMKPNILYSSNDGIEGKTYITNYVDHLMAKFKYSFQGEKAAKLKGYYEIIAQIEGYVVDKEVAITIWTKRFSVVPRTNLKAVDTKLALNKEIALNLNTYNNFVNKVNAESKVTSFTKLTVTMNVNISANTEKGIIKKTFSPEIIMPINVSYFTINKNNSANKQEAILEKAQIKLPVNLKLVVAIGILLTILIIILLYLIFFAYGVDMSKSLKYVINKIFKNHGSRLVALSDEVSEDYSNCIEVRSIDDLVKISDEIGKPILYKYSENYEDINTFYVFDNEKVYKFLLEDILRDTNKSKLAEEKIQIESLEV